MAATAVTSLEAECTELASRISLRCANSDASKTSARDELAGGLELFVQAFLQISLVASRMLSESCEWPTCWPR